MRIGSLHNQLDDKKMKYIINMRKALCKDNICFNDGSLNLKYFNVKKGHYWSHKENELLIEGVIEYGATNFKDIRKECLKDWTETEIRLRICKLLRRYNLDDYKDHKFSCEDEIVKEAKKNREEAQRLDQDQITQMRERNKTGGYERGKIYKPKDPKQIGGIYFNPPPLSEINREYEGKSSNSGIGGSAGMMSSFLQQGALQQQKKNTEKNNKEKEDAKSDKE